MVELTLAKLKGMTIGMPLLWTLVATGIGFAGWVLTEGQGYHGRYLLVTDYDIAHEELAESMRVSDASLGDKLDTFTEQYYRDKRRSNHNATLGKITDTNLEIYHLKKDPPSDEREIQLIELNQKLERLKNTRRCLESTNWRSCEFAIFRGGVE